MHFSSDKLFLGVGSREVQFITDNHNTIEKKVSLPNRWIKGLGNVQVYLSQMEHLFKYHELKPSNFSKRYQQLQLKVITIFLKIRFARHLFTQLQTEQHFHSEESISSIITEFV